MDPRASVIISIVNSSCNIMMCVLIIYHEVILGNIASNVKRSMVLGIDWFYIIFWYSVDSDTLFCVRALE